MYNIFPVPLSLMFLFINIWMSGINNIQISSRNLDCVRKIKSAMTRLTARVQKVCFYNLANMEQA